MIIIPKSVIEKLTKEELQILLDESSSYMEVLEKIGLSSMGGNYTTLNRFISLHSLSTEKIDKNRLNNTDNKRNLYNTKEKFLSELENNTCTLKSNKILKYLIKYGIKEYVCEKCGIDKWNGIPITLELHHKNGNNKDNHLNNLEILCPNCHSQTENFRFKNKMHTKNNEDAKYDLCLHCNKNYKSLSAEMCQECRNKQRGINIPSREVVKDLIRENSFAAIARMYGVTDNAIRRWCKKYELPYRASDIQKISDEEWKII